MAIVVSDASPLRYLVLVGEAEILPALYGQVLVPPAVADELQQPRTPEAVRVWLSRAPAWLEVVPPQSKATRDPALALLGEGERDAIALALERHAAFLLMDDREGVEHARRFGLTVTGTLGVLDRAAARGLIDLPAAVGRLQATNFRAAPEVIRALLERDTERKK